MKKEYTAPTLEVIVYQNDENVMVEDSHPWPFDGMGAEEGPFFE